MPVTAAVTAVLAVLLTALSLNVSRLRLRHKVSFGDGGHRDLLAASRAHGNALEQSLLFVVLLAALESLPGTDRSLLVVLGGAFVAVRLLHPAAVFLRRLPMRQVAHVATLGLQLAAVVAIGVRLVA